MSTSAVTPKIVQVPSIGNIQFPGDMPDDQISAAIQKNFPQLAPKPALNPYQQAADKVPGGTGTSMYSGTQTFDQAHPKPQAGVLQRFAEGAGIPTSQSETTEAVRGMLNPQADPNETDTLLKKEEQIPILGGDFRARAALAKRAANETGPVSVAHKVAALVPLAGPAVAAAQDEYDKGNYAGAVGAGLNALLSMEGVKGSLTPKAPELPVKSLSADTTEAAARPPANPPQIKASVPARTLSSILGGGEKAMTKAPIKQQTAAGRATNAQVRDYAASKGIDLLPGQATGARGLQTLQAEGERAIVMPGDLPDVMDKQKAAFGNLVDDFKKRVGTEAIPDTEAAGTSLKSQAQAGLDNLKQSAQQDYQAFQDKAGDIPVDLSDVKTKASASLASQAEALKNVPAKYANPIRNVLKKLADLQAGPEADPTTLKSFNDAVESYGLNPQQQAALRTKLGLPDEAGNSDFKMSTAQQLRSAYLDISRDYSGNVPKSVQRYAAQAAKDIDAAMTKAADTAGATDQWRQANAKWKQLQQTYNNPEHPLYKVLQEPDAVKIPSRLLGKGNYGGSPNTVRQLQQAGIDLSPLKREVAQQIGDRNFTISNGGNKLSGFSTEFLKTLYSPEEFDELTKIGRVGRAIKFEMNPSGTSNVAEGGRTLRALIRHGGPLAAGAGTGFLLGGPVGALAGGVMAGAGDALVPSIASRLTTSKAFARATMGDVGAKPRGLLDILGSKPPEPPPDVPPAGAAPITPTSGPNAPPAPKAGAAATEERGIKAPQRRTFERIDEKGVKDYFSYRFDQLRNEMKAAQESGDKAAIADVQRRMDELDQIQRQPRSIMDVLGGKPPQSAKIDLNAPKSKRVMPPEVTAKADRSGLKPGQNIPDQTTTKPFRDWFGESKVVDDKGKPMVVYHGTKASTDFESFSPGEIPTDAEGNPLTSGSGADPTAFLGTHFAKEPQVANKFAAHTEGWMRSRYEAQGEKPRIIPAYLSIKTPKNFGNESNLRNFIYEGKIADERALETALSADGLDPYDYENPEVEKWYENYDSDPKFRAEQNRYIFEQARHGDETEHIVDAAQELASQARGRLEKMGHDGVVYKNEVEGGTSFAIFNPEQAKSATGNKGTFNPKDPKIINQDIAPKDTPKPRSLMNILSGANA